MQRNSNPFSHSEHHASMKEVQEGEDVLIMTTLVLHTCTRINIYENLGRILGSLLHTVPMEVHPVKIDCNSCH